MRPGHAAPTTVLDVAQQLPGASLVGPRPDTVLRDVTHDSRTARADTLFCAIVGAVTDGHDHAADAVANGASALLVERPLDDLDVPQVQVPDTRAAAGPAAAIVHHQPSRDLRMVGITGTNGKTTTSYLVEHAVAGAGIPVGVIGTIEARIHGEAQKGVRTTPEGPDLQRLLRTMHDRGVDAVVMEVSSHGLALHRVDGIEFAVGAYLNLTQDHLDFHPDMEDYFLAKARLFDLAREAVVCIEDAWGRRLARQLTVPTTTFGRPERCDGVEPDWAVEDVRAVADGTSLRLAPSGAGDAVEVRTRLVGDVNGLNAAAAWLLATAVGVDGLQAAAGIAACPGVPGRLEPVPNDAGLTVLVDYAHTPDAIEQVVRIARDVAAGGRVLVVVGCGGDRDHAKRAPMGAAAARADVAVLTSDNPRSEDPEAILDQMMAGVDEPVGEVVRELDRRRAIGLALERARPGDVVVLAGKGHETGQTFADRTVPFDDREVADELLRARVSP